MFTWYRRFFQLFPISTYITSMLKLTPHNLDPTDLGYLKQTWICVNLHFLSISDSWKTFHFKNIPYIIYMNLFLNPINCYLSKSKAQNPINTGGAELSKSLSCLSDNRSGRCGQCVRPIKHLPDLHIFYNFNWITHILANSIKLFVYQLQVIPWNTQS